MRFSFPSPRSQGRKRKPWERGWNPALTFSRVVSWGVVGFHMCVSKSNPLGIEYAFFVSKKVVFPEKVVLPAKTMAIAEQHVCQNRE